MKRPLRIEDAPRETWYAGTDREIHGVALSDIGGRAKVGVGLLELPPGAHTRPAHYHTREEEHLYVLSGAGNLHLGDETFALAAGSYVCFPANQAAAHYIHNTGSEPLRYLMIGERLDDDVVRYPDA